MIFWVIAIAYILFLVMIVCEGVVRAKLKNVPPIMKKFIADQYAYRDVEYILITSKYITILSNRLWGI